MPIDRERRIGFVPLEHEVDRLARLLQGRVFQRPLRKHRRVTGRDQQHVAFAQRHIEPLGEPQHHVARGLRTPGFEKAQMLGRNLCIEREIELAEAAALAPLAQVIADGTCFHAGKIVQGARRLHYLPVNRPADRPGLDDGTGAVTRRAKQNRSLS